EQLRRAGAGDLDLGERGLVEERGRLAAGAVLGVDRGRPEPAGPAAGPERLVAVRGVRIEPVRPLPARLPAEGGAQAQKRRVGPETGGRSATSSAAGPTAARATGT